MTGKSSKSVDLAAAWVGTPLDLIHQILENEDFGPGSDTPVAENEEVVGEMTPLEKAIYSARHRVLAPYIEKMQKGEDLHLNDLGNNTLVAKAYDKLLWSVIQSRLDAGSLERRFGVRHGFKIVKRPENLRADTEIHIIAGPSSGLAAALASAFGKTK